MENHFERFWVSPQPEAFNMLIYLLFFNRYVVGIFEKGGVKRGKFSPTFVFSKRNREIVDFGGKERKKDSASKSKIR